MFGKSCIARWDRVSLYTKDIANGFDDSNCYNSPAISITIVLKAYRYLVALYLSQLATLYRFHINTTNKIIINILFHSHQYTQAIKHFVV